MATKIDTIKLGTSEYEIDLKSTATPTISSLTTSRLTVTGYSSLSNVDCNGNITLSHITGTSPDGTIKTRYIKNVNFDAGGSTVEFPLAISSENNLDLNASGLLNITSGESTDLTGNYIWLNAAGDGLDNYIGMDDEGIMLFTKGGLRLEGVNFRTIADNSHLGGIQPWYSVTGTTTYNGTTSDETSPAINSASTTSGRFYPIGVDANGRAFVNVPWVELVSGTNIKSINHKSILSSGNLQLLEPNTKSITTGTTGGWESTFFSDYGTNNSCRIVYGTVSINKTSFHNQSITFAKSMPSSNYAVILTPVINDSAASREVFTSVYSRSTTGFVCNGHINNTSYKITYLHYIAIYVS